MPKPQNFVVLGEASESDEDEVNGALLKYIFILVENLQVPKSIHGVTIVDGEAPESDEGNILT